MRHFSRVLTNNEIAELPSGAFSHLPVLEELLLDNNQISSVSSEFFDSLPNLRRLLVHAQPLHLMCVAFLLCLQSFGWKSAAGAKYCCGVLQPHFSPRAVSATSKLICRFKWFKIPIICYRSIQRTPLGELQGSVFSGLSALTNL